MPTTLSNRPRAQVKRYGRGRGSSRSTRFEHLMGRDGRSLVEIEADLEVSRSRIAERDKAAGITEDMTIFERKEALDRYHDGQVKQRCRGQCGRWVPRGELSPNLKYCKTCAAVHRSEQSAYVNRALPTGSKTSGDQLAADTADLFTDEPAEPSLVGMIANLEAARARIAKLDAMTEGEEPVEEAQSGTWDEGCKPFEFFCKGCGRTRPSAERVETYVKRGCRIIATLEVCRDCSTQVSVYVRG